MKKNAKGMTSGKHFTKSLPLGNGVRIVANVVDGKEKIGAETSPLDIVNGKIADPARCVDANCLMRYGSERKLPHPAYAVWVCKRMAYILLTREPGKGGRHTVVRYLHRGWKYIREFDRTVGMSPTERLKKIAPRLITLYPPTKTNKVGAYNSRTPAGKQSGEHTNGHSPKKREPRGYAARLVTLEQWKENMELSGLRPAARG